MPRALCDAKALPQQLISLNETLTLAEPISALRVHPNAAYEVLASHETQGGEGM